MESDTVINPFSQRQRAWRLDSPLLEHTHISKTSSELEPIFSSKRVVYVYILYPQWIREALVQRLSKCLEWVFGGGGVCAVKTLKVKQTVFYLILIRVIINRHFKQDKAAKLIPAHDCLRGAFFQVSELVRRLRGSFT